MSRIAFIFPGQGAQYPGMGEEFARHYPIAKQTFEEADDLLGRSLSKEIFTGTKEALKETSTSQPALYVVSIALLRVLNRLFPEITPAVTAGLSLGEYTALTAAGILPFAEALMLVKTRANAMQEACLMQKSSMQVVMGLEPFQIQEAIDSLSERLKTAAPVWIANLNCPGQVVISGKLDALEHLRPFLEEKKAKRILSLEVAGAFHSPLMHSASMALKEPINACTFKPATSKLVMNVPGDFVDDQTLQRQNLLQQVTSPVLWQKGLHKMNEAGITHYIEIGAGKTLSGMLKRTLPTSTCINIENVSDLTQMETL